MPTEANSINAATTGIVGNTGTAFTGTAVTQYNVILGGSTSSTLTNVAPSAASGVPLISQGAASNPIFGTAVVAGGGTGAVTLTGVLTGNGTNAITASTVTQHGVIVGGASNAVSSTAVGSTGQVLQGNSAADPTYSTATYPSSATGTGTILRADGTNWSATTATYPNTTGSNTFLTSTTANTVSTATFIPLTSFTPTMAFGGSNTGITYATQFGRYMQIGSAVYFLITISLTSKGAQVGNATIEGLPVATSGSFGNQNNNAVTQYGNVTLPVGSLTCLFENGNNATNGVFYTNSITGGTTVLTNTNFANNSTVQVQGFYFVI